MKRIYRSLMLATILSLTIVPGGSVLAQTPSYVPAPTSPATNPVLLYKINPLYTEEAFAAGLQGRVLISLVVATNGIPTNLVIEQSLGGGLDEAAVAAAARWRFKPASRGGQPIPMAATLSFDFVLRNGTVAAAIESDHSSVGAPSAEQAWCLATEPVAGCIESEQASVGAPSAEQAPEESAETAKQQAKRLKAEKKAEEKRRAAQERQRYMLYCVRLEKKPMAELTDSDLSALRTCHYLNGW